MIFLEQFKYISWRTVVNLWRNSVAQTLCIFDAECLFDIPFGQGFCHSYGLFKEAVIMADKEAAKKGIGKIKIEKNKIKIGGNGR